MVESGETGALGEIDTHWHTCGTHLDVERDGAFLASLAGSGGIGWRGVTADSDRGVRADFFGDRARRHAGPCAAGDDWGWLGFWAGGGRFFRRWLRFFDGLGGGLSNDRRCGSLNGCWL